MFVFTCLGILVTIESVVDGRIVFGLQVPACHIFSCGQGLMECIDTLVSHHPVLSDSIVCLTERGRERAKERAMCEKVRESERERVRAKVRKKKRERLSQCSPTAQGKREGWKKESRTQE